MPIDDILEEKTGYKQRQAAQNGQGAQTTSITTSDGTITLQIPDPTSGTQESMVFWMNVAQTALLLYIAWQLG